MKDLYIVINETKDGKYLGECPMLKYSISGYSLTEVKNDMLQAVRVYLESDLNPMNNEVQSEKSDKRVIRGYRGFKRSKRSVVPKW